MPPIGAPPVLDTPPDAGPEPIWPLLPPEPLATSAPPPLVVVATWPPPTPDVPPLSDAPGLDTPLQATHIIEEMTMSRPTWVGLGIGTTTPKSRFGTCGYFLMNPKDAHTVHVFERIPDGAAQRYRVGAISRLLARPAFVTDSGSGSGVKPAMACRGRTRPCQSVTPTEHSELTPIVGGSS